MATANIFFSSYRQSDTASQRQQPGANVIKLFTLVNLSVFVISLSMASFSSLVLYLRIKPEPTEEYSILV